MNSIQPTEEWYEIGVVYDDMTTKTVIAFSSVEQAKQYAEAMSIDSNVDGIFIDKWVKVERERLQHDDTHEYFSTSRRMKVMKDIDFEDIVIYDSSWDWSNSEGYTEKE